MKKRIMALFMAMAIVVVATGCGKGYKVGENGEVYNDYVKIKKWKELEVEKIEPPAVTEEEIDSAIITDLQSEWKKVGIKDRAAVDGDTVIINYEGKIDGVPFAGGTAKNAPLKLGSKTFIEGFESGIVGYVPGDTFDLNLSFPEDYGNAELAGKAVVFTVTLNAIQPEYSEALVPKLSAKATTTEEYRAEKKAEIEKSNQEAAEEQMRSNLLETLFEQCEVIEYPKERLEETIETVTDSYTAQVEMYYGMTLEELKETYGATEEQLFGASFEDLAKQQLLDELAVELIQKVGKLDFSDKFYEKFLEEQAKLYGYEDSDAFEEDWEEIYGEDSFEFEFKKAKVAEFLYEHCKVVEPKAADSSETVTE